MISQLIRISFQVLLFTLTFVLEVRVHASEAHEPVPVADAPVAKKAHANQTIVLLVQQEPANCLKSKDVCAIKTREGQTFELVIDEKTQIVLDHSSAVIRLSKNEIRLISGSVWVKAQESFQVKSEFGDVIASHPGEFWVSRSDDRMTVKATEVSVELKPRGSNETLTVDSGLQNYIGRVGLDGKAETGIPMAIPFRMHLDQWARLYRGDKASFETEVAAFHVRWKMATQESSDINRQVYERMVSSADDAAKAQAEREAKVQAERTRHRKLFRSRVFDGL